MDEEKKDPLFGAAILKLSFLLKGKADEPGFRVVYFGTLNDLGVTNTEVDDYIKEHHEELIAHIQQAKKAK